MPKKYIALLRRLLAPAEPKPTGPAVIRTGRVLSDGCGR